VFATLKDERGHRIHHLKLESWANAWSTPSDRRGLFVSDEHD